MPTTNPESTRDHHTSGSDDSALTEELAGLDALELGGGRRKGRAARLWSAAWPKVGAIALAIFLWQLVVWSGWKPTYVLPGPRDVFAEVWARAKDGTLWTSVAVTLRRALTGYSLALVIGVVVGALVSQVRVLRSAFGSLITGLQTMPSIAWFPAAILIFKLSEAAILFVVVLGAAPAIANGLIAGADNVPPLLLRAGRVLGARRVGMYRDVVLPASMPTFVSGMKQGWAFAWRSLLAGELLVIIAHSSSLGVQLQVSRDLADATGLYATMVVILVVGIIVDGLGFSTLERFIQSRWGLRETAR